MRRSSASLIVLCAIAVTGASALAGASAATKPAFTFRHNHLAQNGGYGEPSLSVSTKGKIAVCTPGGADNMWLSANDGKTFTTAKTHSPNGGGDCELEYLPNGDLLNADLEV